MGIENLYQVVVVNSEEDHHLAKYVEDDEATFILEVETDNWWRAEDFFLIKDIHEFKVIT